MGVTWYAWYPVVSGSEEEGGAVSRRNLTLQLDEDVIRRARVAAAKRGTSVSGLVAHQLEDLVEHDRRYEEAMRRALDALRTAARRGGRRWRRSDLYERQ